jgi:acetyltransferase
MKGGRTCLLRPIRPEDEPNHHILVSRLTPEDIRFRFFGLVQQLPHSQMARMTQIDYDREMAFIATARDDQGLEETLGVVRAVTDPDNEATEFSIVVRSDLKGSGLAREMMKKMIRYCRDRKTVTMVGQVLKENGRMLHFVESLGFRKTRTVDIDVVEVELDLQGDLPFA